MLLGGGGGGVKQHIHLFYMMQRVDIPSLLYPFVSMSFVLVVFVHVKYKGSVNSFESLYYFLPALPINLHHILFCLKFVCELHSLPFCPPVVSE